MVTYILDQNGDIGWWIGKYTKGTFSSLIEYMGKNGIWSRWGMESGHFKTRREAIRTFKRVVGKGIKFISCSQFHDQYFAR